MPRRIEGPIVTYRDGVGYLRRTDNHGVAAQFGFGEVEHLVRSRDGESFQFRIEAPQAVGV